MSFCISVANGTANINTNEKGASISTETKTRLKLLMQAEYDLYHFIKQRFYSVLNAWKKGLLNVNTFKSVPNNYSDFDANRNEKLHTLLDALDKDKRKCEICWHELQNI